MREHKVLVIETEGLRGGNRPPHFASDARPWSSTPETYPIRRSVSIKGGSKPALPMARRSVRQRADAAVGSRECSSAEIVRACGAQVLDGRWVFGGMAKREFGRGPRDSCRRAQRANSPALPLSPGYPLSSCSPAVARLRFTRSVKRSSHMADEQTTGQNRHKRLPGREGEAGTLILARPAKAVYRDEADS